MSSFIEICFFSPKAGSETTSEGAELRQLMLDTPGVEAAYRGKQVENPALVDAVKVWASKDAYTGASASVEKAKALIASMADESVTKPVHTTASLKGAFSAIADAPVVRLAALFLPADVDTAAFEAAWGASLAGGAPPAGFKAGAFGWADEIATHHPTMNPAKVWLSFVGWESAEASEAAKDKAETTFGGLKSFGGVLTTHTTTFAKAK